MPQVRLNRFELNPKGDAKKCNKDLEMLLGVAAVFDTPHVLPLMRSLGEALEQLLARGGKDPLRTPEDA